MRNFTIVMLTLLGSIYSFGQYTPSYVREIVITETENVNHADYQVRLSFDTQTEVGAGRMNANGSDIRFMTSNSCDTTQYFPHWIEEAMNTDTTIIWVKLPTLASLDIDTIYMYYGDVNAFDLSSFAMTFPNAIISGGTNVNLTGANDISWLQIDAGDTLFVGAGAVLDITARNVVINGVIYGQGAGYASPGPGVLLGNGPGGGTGGTSSGAGGGSYGGVGGNGGYDSGDPINAGGAIYGSTSGIDINMGSSGGSVSTVAAGAGGAGVSLYAEFVEINGTVNVNGALAQQPGGGQGAGGGAGGGFMVLSDNLWFTGNITADGNGGSIGTSTANDDGGGGGGGRVKLFYENYGILTGSMSANGGAGGLYGTAAPGMPGAVGTTYSGVNPFDQYTLTVNAMGTISSTPTPVVATLTDVTETCSATPTAPEATDLCGSIVTGTPDVTFPITTVGTTTVTWTYTDGFGGTATQTQNVIITGVNTSVTQTGSTLTSDLNGATYQWVDCGNNYSAVAGATNQSFLPSVPGDYAVIVTDNGCSDTSNCFTVDFIGLDELGNYAVSVYPNPTTGVITVKSFTGEKSITVMDASGRVIYSTESSSEETSIDLREKGQGVYFIELNDGVRSKIEKVVVK